MEEVKRRLFPIGRCTRGQILALLVSISILKFFFNFIAFGQVSLTLNLGFGLEALTDPANYPLWYVATEALFGLSLAYLAVGRLHDIARPGWWLAILLALPYAGDLVGLPEIAFVSLIAWLALIFWSPTIGPNIYGADPRGWTSRDHYEAQRAALRQHPPAEDQAADR